MVAVALCSFFVLLDEYEALRLKRAIGLKLVVNSETSRYAVGVQPTTP